METHADSLQSLERDMLMKILKSLDDPCDLIRVSVLSHYWRDFVIANGLCKQMCFRLFPQISSVAYVTEPSCGTKESAHVGSSNSVELETFEREHRVYAFLVRALTTFTASDCVAVAISTSSPDHYLLENIRNTLNPRDRVLGMASYWSSKGHGDPAVPETLIYKLIADVCVITEISVQPFQAYFESGKPIYSARSVRFRMGHPRSPTDIPNDLRDLPLQLPADDKFIWTYTSQEFSMAQENSLQKFKLPEPVVCIGGCLQIELLGRVQKNEMNGLYYICIAHVEALGRSLFPAFDVDVLEPWGKFALKYYPEVQNRPPPVGNEPDLDDDHDEPDLDLDYWDYDDNERDLFFIR